MLYALRSDKTPGLRFVVASPGRFFPDYAPLLDASDVAPESDRVDGWAPQATGSMVLPAAWRAADPLRLLVLRVSGPPTEFDLRSAAVVGVDELVVALPAAVTLDEQLATFADIAEGLPTPVRPPG